MVQNLGIRIVLFVVFLAVVAVITLQIRAVCKRKQKQAQRQAKRQAQGQEAASRSKRVNQHKKGQITGFIICILLISILTVGSGMAALKILGSTEAGTEEVSSVEGIIPHFIGPISSTDDISQGFFLSEVTNSSMLNLGLGVFNGIATTAEDLAAMISELFNFLEECRQNNKPISLYAEIEIGDPIEDVIFQKATTYEECDQQIAQAQYLSENTQNANRKASFFELMAISALDGLLLCKETDATADLYWYYGEIAFYALVNQYIYKDKTSSASSAPSSSQSSFADLYYRLGQVFDCMGWIADTKEMQYRMYFISAACCYKGCQLLQTPSNGVYRDTIWLLYLTMLQRIELYVANDQKKGFYQLALDCQADIERLELSQSERDEVTGRLASMEDALP